MSLEMQRIRAAVRWMGVIHMANVREPEPLGRQVKKVCAVGAQGKIKLD